MSEKTTETPAESTEKFFALQRAYLKDASLEMPNAPQIFLEQGDSDIEVAINVGAQRLADTVFESSVRVTVTSKFQDKVVFLVEATQGGIFEISHFEDSELDPLLGIVCPSILYPYLRANVADLLSRASLPPFHLREVNFQALYEQELQKLAESAQEKSEDTETPDTQA